MMKQSDIRVARNGLVLQTWGLGRYSHPELRLSIKDSALLEEGEAFLRFVVDYLVQGDTKIKPDETLTYGYWLTKFVLSSEGVLEVFEYNAEATEFIEGAELALTYWRDQHAVCNQVRATFDPPRPDKKVAISAGVYEGDPVEGVRYPSPEHMSGWWLTTDRYDGNIKSLNVVHLYHVTAARPDLARYLALPPGFRFSTSEAQATDIWFDEKVAKSAQKG